MDSRLFRIFDEKVWPVVEALSASQSPGDWRPQPHRGNLFKAFAEVHNIDPGLDTEFARQFLHDTHLSGAPDEDPRNIVLNEIFLAWHEWAYAWDHADLKK